MEFTAKDVQKLRQETGVGILDAKKALEANNGDMDEARKWLRVQGLASAAKRADREASQGAVSVVRDGSVAAIVEMRCETDFVAKSPEFVSLVDEIAARVAAEDESATSAFKDQIETMLTTLKENISARQSRPAGRWRRRGCRDVPAQAVRARRERRGGCRQGREQRGRQGDRDSRRLRAPHLLEPCGGSRRRSRRRARDDRGDFRKEGKPDAAMPKIIEGRLNAWYKDRVLLEQNFVKDEKMTIEQYLNGATITAFAQVVIGA